MTPPPTTLHTQVNSFFLTAICVPPNPPPPPPPPPFLAPNPILLYSKEETRPGELFLTLCRSDCSSAVPLSTWQNFVTACHIVLGLSCSKTLCYRSLDVLAHQMLCPPSFAALLVHCPLCQTACSVPCSLSFACVSIHCLQALPPTNAFLVTRRCLHTLMPGSVCRSVHANILVRPLWRLLAVC